MHYFPCTLAALNPTESPCPLSFGHFFSKPYINAIAPLNNPRCTGHRGRFDYKEFAIELNGKAVGLPFALQWLNPLRCYTLQPPDSQEVGRLPETGQLSPNCDGCFLLLWCIVLLCADPRPHRSD